MTQAVHAVSLLKKELARLDGGCATREDGAFLWIATRKA